LGITLATRERPGSPSAGIFHRVTPASTPHTPRPDPGPRPGPLAAAATGPQRPKKSLDPRAQAPDSAGHVTRLAPSPTGALHLGNARTFLVNWALARQRGWSILYRLEDLDDARNKPGAAERLAGALRWLGLDWDRETPPQSADQAPYLDAMRALAAEGRVYPCDLSRKEIEAASTAPHAGEGEPRYPPGLRPAERPDAFTDEGTNWRFVTPDRDVAFTDESEGPQTFNPQREVGDFVVWTRRACPSYQLAVALDDHRHGVTHIVRGRDLLPSTARQRLLREALALAPEPEHLHLPLVVGPDGRRLAKRHGDTRLDRYRDDAAVPPERVVGLLARWSGASADRTPMTAAEFAERFDLASMPREDAVFTEEDDHWLRTGSS